MKNYKQTLMTVFVVFATAYILTIVGCAKSTDVSGAPPAAPAVPAPVPPPAGPIKNPPGEVESELDPINPEDLRECNKDEFGTLIDWSNDLSDATEAIEAVDGRKDSKVVRLAVKAIEKCDQVQFYHSQQPCKKTKMVRNVPNPDVVTQEVKTYDAYSIHKRCAPVDTYLKKFNLRPDPNQNHPEPQPAPVDPNPSEPDMPNQVQQCSNDEFAKLNLWRSALDLANKNIARLGGQANWKFDANALQASKTATVACENLMAYHQAHPCKREKTYTRQVLREQCAIARTYYYNYAQRTESLIVPNAKLYLDTKVLGNKMFNIGPANLALGQCVITNNSAAVIAYKGQKTLVTEARVSTNQEELMFVLVTQEGLKLECYGMDYSSAATSLTEVMKILTSKDTPLSMSYELN